MYVLVIVMNEEDSAGLAMTENTYSNAFIPETLASNASPRLRLTAQLVSPQRELFQRWKMSHPRRHATFNCAGKTAKHTHNEMRIASPRTRTHKTIDVESVVRLRSWNRGLPLRAS